MDGLRLNALKRREREGDDEDPNRRSGKKKPEDLGAVARQQRKHLIQLIIQTFHALGDALPAETRRQILTNLYGAGPVAEAMVQLGLAKRK